MRLIDADELRNNLLMMECMEDVVEIIDSTQTAYNVDEVMEELEEIGKKYCENVDCHMYQDCDGCEHKDLMECATEIVKRGGVNDD